MLIKDDAVLVLVDIQGKLATLMHDRDKFYENLVRLIRGAKVLNIPILWNEQLPDKLGPTQDIIKAELDGLKPLVKSAFSCCGNEAFVEALEKTGRKKVILAGMESHVCVYQTARDLIEDDYEVYVIADAVSSRTPENRQIGLETMRDLGATIASVEMSLLEMLVVAGTDQFRQVVKIIK